MYRGCVFCKMRDAIFGCMGGQPDNTGELPKGGNSERKYVFDTKGLRSEKKSPTEPKHVTGRRSDKLPCKTAGQKGTHSQGHLLKGQGHRKEGVPTRPKTLRSQPVPPTKVQYRSHPRRNNYYQRNGGYETGHYNARYCKFFERQYQRDLLRRQAERLPLLEYTYKNGRPIRGILKKPQFVRTPRMDELIFVEVGSILTACYQWTQCIGMNFILVYYQFHLCRLCVCKCLQLFLLLHLLYVNLLLVLVLYMLSELYPYFVWLQLGVYQY